MDSLTAALSPWQSPDQRGRTTIHLDNAGLLAAEFCTHLFFESKVDTIRLSQCSVAGARAAGRPLPLGGALDRAVPPDDPASQRSRVELVRVLLFDNVSLQLCSYGGEVRQCRNLQELFWRLRPPHGDRPEVTEKEVRMDVDDNVAMRCIVIRPDATNRGRMSVSLHNNPALCSVVFDDSHHADTSVQLRLSQLRNLKAVILPPTMRVTRLEVTHCPELHLEPLLERGISEVSLTGFDLL